MMPYEIIERTACIICPNCDNKLIPIADAVLRLLNNPEIKKKCEFCGHVFDLQPFLPDYETMSINPADYVGKVSSEDYEKLE